MSETLRLKTEVEGFELELRKDYLITTLNGKPKSVSIIPSNEQVNELTAIFQKKKDPNWNFFDRVIAIVDKHSKKKVLPTV